MQTLKSNDIMVSLIRLREMLVDELVGVAPPPDLALTKKLNYLILGMVHTLNDLIFNVYSPPPHPISRR